jgi:hypothetical protein
MTEAKLIAPNGETIIGTLESIPGVALLGEIRGIGADGVVDCTFADQTDVDWNAQETVKRRLPGERMTGRVWVDYSGAQWCESQLTFVPADEETPEPEAETPDLVLLCELADRFLNEGEPLSTSERAAAQAALERVRSDYPEFNGDARFVAAEEPHHYRRDNLEVGGFRWPSIAEVPAGPDIQPLRTPDDEAEKFGVFTKDDGGLVDEFDDRAAAEEYLDAIAHG